jgi:hypothetical protein
MEKLNFEQIIEKLKTIFDDVKDFANNDIEYTNTPKSEKVLKLEIAYSEWLKNNPCPKQGTVECDEWRKKRIKVQDKYLEAWEDEWFNNIGLKWKHIYKQCEEGGDHWESVKYFPQHDVYIKIVGYYSSYNGVSFEDEWGCCSEVRPKKKTITIYE